MCFVNILLKYQNFAVKICYKEDKLTVIKNDKDWRRGYTYLFINYSQIPEISLSSESWKIHKYATKISKLLQLKWIKKRTIRWTLP